LTKKTEKDKCKVNTKVEHFGSLAFGVAQANFDKIARSTRFVFRAVGQRQVFF
jgi:hypothetical protein